MKKYIPLAIGLLAVSLLLILSYNLGKAQEAGPAAEPAQPAAVNDAVKSYIPVQGRLTDASGNPLDGAFDITFRLYNTATGGTELCQDKNFSVPVEQGLFYSEIWGNCADDITGDQLYLGIQVGTDDEMTPRQPIYAVPYAWSLRPGAVISASLGSTPNLHLETWSASGRAIRAYAMSTTGANYGVVGASRSSSGYGGYFYNNGGGIGLWGMSNSAGAPGMYAQGVDYGADLVLGGNNATTSGDDGRLTSDPAYPSSDLVFVSNDTIRLDLDNDAGGEDADFEIYNGNNTNIFNVDQSGTVTYGGAGIAAYPRPAYDSGYQPVDQGETINLSHNLGGNVDNYIVDLTCKVGSGNGINGFGLGGDYNYDEFYGAYWRSLTTSSVTVMRLDQDLDCAQVRVRIWMYP